MSPEIVTLPFQSTVNALLLALSAVPFPMITAYSLLESSILYLPKAV